MQIQDEEGNLWEKILILAHHVCPCSHRLAGGDAALSDLVRRREELSTWLEQAENAARSLPVAATDKNLKELKVRRGSKQSKHGSAESSASDPALGRVG